MANADDMRRLAQEVANAYEERVNSINAIKTDTAAWLNESGKAHQEMAENLRAELTGFKTNLDAAENDRKTADQAEIKARQDYMENFLAEFDKARQEMADNLRTELAKFKEDLDAAEGDRKTADQAEIRERGTYIENLLAEFDKVHQEMADNLRTELAKFKADLDAAEGDRKTADQAEIWQRDTYNANHLAKCDKVHQEMAENLRTELAKFKADLDAAEGDRKTADQAEIRERGAYIENLLAEFDKVHQEMADNLRAELAKFKADLDAAEGDRKTADQAEVKERQEAVRAMLDEFRQEQEEASAAWKGLLAEMQTLREKATITGLVEAESAVEMSTAEEAIEEAIEEKKPEEPPEEEIAEEEKPEEPLEEEPEEAFEEEATERDVDEEVLTLLEEHPDGLKMVEIADALGVDNWRSMIPIIRQLLDDEEIEKIDSTYFAV